MNALVVALLAASLPNLTYSPAELMKPLSFITSTDPLGFKRGHSSVAMHRGRLLVVHALDSGLPGGAVSFWNIDNPRAPVRVSKAEEFELREAHVLAFEGDTLALLATGGVQLWNVADALSPRRLSYLKLPGVSASDYATGTWWLSWQPPYLYVSGCALGLFVVDTRDTAAPKLLATIPTAQTGGFRVGPNFAVGNRLIISSMDQPGYAVLDISDPVRPTLLRSLVAGAPTIYSINFNGGRVYAPGDDGKLYVHDVEDPTGIKQVGVSAVAGSRGGYASVQDGFVHSGFSDRYSKLDARTANVTLVGSASSGKNNRDEDFAVVLGNLVFIGDDHGEGSALVPHQTAPDTTPPGVNFVSPAHSSTGVAATSRVGVTFSDLVDHASVGPSSFIVRVRGGPQLIGRYAVAGAVANFTPDVPLPANTTFDVSFPAGGVRDEAGNALGVPFTASFDTGVSRPPLSCTVSAAPVQLGASAQVAATASRPGATLSFDFGDGSALGAAGAHTYARPGHFPVVVTAADGADRATCSGIVTVHRPLTSLKPSVSSTVLLAHGKVWTVNSDSDSVSVFDAATLGRQHEVKVGAGPRTLARSARGAFVVSQRDASLSVIEDGAVVKRVALQPRSAPYGVAASPDGRYAYVTLEATGELVRVDTATFEVSQALAVGATPRGVSVTADSKRVFVSRFISPEAGGQVVEVDAERFAVARTVRLAVDVGLDTESSGRGVPSYVGAAALSPDGVYAWVPAKKDNVQRGLKRDGLPLTFENTVRSMVAQLEVSGGVELLAARRDLDNRSLPVAVAFSGLGDWAYVASFGSNTVEAIDAYSARIEGGVSDAGRGPDGLAVDAAGQRLFVHASLSRSLRVYDLATSPAAPVFVVEKATVDVEPLPANVLLGKRLFHDASDRRMNRSGYLACASCHFEGMGDGRVWDFTGRGEGLRNTKDLRGRGGVADGALHWSANFDELQDFERDIVEHLGGSGLLDGKAMNPVLGASNAGLSADLDALAAYVTSLAEAPQSPYRLADGSLTDGARRGLGVFQRAGCAQCHASPRFSDGKQHDVGTLGAGSGQRLGEPLTAIDTPSLSGVWASAPYLHDGSAATLEEVLARGNKVELTKALSPAERADLVEYLLSIDGRVDSGEMMMKPPVVQTPVECGCGSTPGALLLLAALVLRRRSRSAA